MRKSTEYKGPILGDKRKRKTFLIFPKTINNECRWLEFAEWEEILEHIFMGFEDGNQIYWRGVKWLN